MPICCHCHTAFARLSYSGPAEDCDCGRNETKDEYRERTEADREPTEDELEAYRQDHRSDQ